MTIVTVTWYTDQGNEFLESVLNDRPNGMARGAYIKKILADHFHVDLPEREYHKTSPSKLAPFGASEKERIKNVRATAQYILDHWSEMPENVKNDLIRYQLTENIMTGSSR